MTPEEVKSYLRERKITVEGSECPRPVRTFAEACLPDYLIKELEGHGFTGPTPIQAQGWPAVMSGRDVIGIADTGSGKTLAFLIPAIVHINAQPLIEPGDGPIVLILTPTRELAMQIQEEAIKFSSACRIRTACVYGGTTRAQQAAMLREGVDIVVATPGRLVDMLETRKTNLRRVTYFVLDEADRMLDMGFEPVIRKVAELVRPDRQTLFWTATWPQQIQDVAQEFVRNPVKIVVGNVEVHAAASVQQCIRVCKEGEKEALLRELLEEIAVDGAKIIIFTETKRSADALTKNLRVEGWPAFALHGDKLQEEREWVLSEFRSGRTPILVATDIAARGLDVKDVRYVVNYTIPQTPETYVHRIGRTGRTGSGSVGKAYSFFTPEDFAAAGWLANLLKSSNQPVNPQLLPFVK